MTTTSLVLASDALPSARASCCSAEHDGAAFTRQLDAAWASGGAGGLRGWLAVTRDSHVPRMANVKQRARPAKVRGRQAWFRCPVRSRWIV